MHNVDIMPWKQILKDTEYKQLISCLRIYNNFKKIKNLNYFVHVLGLFNIHASQSTKLKSHLLARKHLNIP